MEDNHPTRKPLSSASAIMHRHTKKKKKWLHNLLHGDEAKRGEKKTDASRSLFYMEKPDKSVSKSLENIGQINLSVAGFSSCPERSSSVLQLPPRDDDDMSVTSVSSCDSDCSAMAEGFDDTGRHRHTSKSSNSSDTENISDNEPLYIPISVTRAQDSGFSNWFSYLPFGIGYNITQGSTESLNSQSEERKTLAHLLGQSDSDQVMICV